MAVINEQARKPQSYASVECRAGSLAKKNTKKVKSTDRQTGELQPVEKFGHVFPLSHCSFRPYL